jgi:hypothetical protein
MKNQWVADVEADLRIFSVLTPEHPTVEHIVELGYSSKWSTYGYILIHYENPHM